MKQTWSDDFVKFVRSYVVYYENNLSRYITCVSFDDNVQHLLAFYVIVA